MRKYQIILLILITSSILGCSSSKQIKLKEVSLYIPENLTTLSPLAINKKIRDSRDISNMMLELFKSRTECINKLNTIQKLYGRKDKNG